VTRSTAESLVAEYPGPRVHGVVCDYETHLERIPRREGALIAFLGGTIGNFRPGPRRAFLARIATLMYPEDRFLLGTDLIKDRRRLEAAYNDSAGVTARFNKNLLRVLNRNLAADFVPDAFEHVAFWDPDNCWMDLRLRSVADQLINVGDLGIRIPFERNEEMRTEVSTKFSRERVQRAFVDAGLELVEWWTDPTGSFPWRGARLNRTVRVTGSARGRLCGRNDHGQARQDRGRMARGALPRRVPGAA
jgi:L-histidine Nalpha-methyltransferase